MVLKPQDVCVMLKLITMGDRRWTYVKLAKELFMSPSEVNAGVKRAIEARLAISSESFNGSPRPIRKALEEFLVHGVQYAFPPHRGELTRGLPTASAAPPLKDLLSPTEDPPPVWPSPEETVRGYSFSPLYKSIPKAARLDNRLYELLALVDSIRGGRARERNMAAEELRKRLA